MHILYMHPLSSKWNRLAVCPCYCWATDCGAKCPKHKFSPQITCELFFLNDRLLPHYWLSVCTRFGGIHLKAIQRCCVRQEVSALAHRIIHSVSRTQRGLSSLVSLLLAFKECVCAQCTCENVRVCSCMHMSLLEHRIIPQVKHAPPYSTAWPVTTGICEAQVRTCTGNRYR